MTTIEIIDAFTFYGIDVILLAALTTVIVQVLKSTLLKKIPKKLVTFLPFLIGTLFYAIYAAIKNMSFFYIFDEYVSVLEYGLSVGSLSTLLYVLYEQFVREKNGLTTTESVISTLIEGYVPEDSINEVAKLLAEAVERDVTGNGAKRIAEILTDNTDGNTTDGDITLLAKLIIETLAHMNTQ